MSLILLSTCYFFGQREGDPPKTWGGRVALWFWDCFGFVNGIRSWGTGIGIRTRAWQYFKDPSQWEHLLLLFSNFQASPFCTGSPVFSLAEPSDVIIICGEFNSGVEILSESYEPEQVFTVTKIIQHPDYKPTTVSPKIMIPLRLDLINC